MENQIPPENFLDRKKEAANQLVISYLSLRNAIGISGLLLPFILLINTWMNSDKMQTSISNYYYTGNGDLFIAIICILSVFLLTYKGYNWIDSFWSKLAALCGLGVAFFPTSWKEPDCSLNIHIRPIHTPTFPGTNFEWHLVFATIFFISISIMSLFLFPKSDDKNKGHKINGKRTRKGKRNIVYRVCGIIMLACVFILFLYKLIPAFEKLFGNFPLIFWLETLALIAFGISWLTKGEALLPDQKHDYKKILRSFTNFGHA